MMISAFILFVHLLFKELRHLFGRLMMLYNLGWILLCATIIIQLLIHYKVAVNSQTVCHAIKLSIMTATLDIEALALCMFTHLAYVVYQSYKLQRITETKTKYLYKCYIAYVLCTLTIFLFLTMIYDIGTGSRKYTLQLDGHCSPYVQKANFMINVFIGVNKILQLLMLVAYFTYLFKLYKMQTELYPPAFSNSQHNQQLFKVALVMAASVISSQFFWLFSAVVGTQIEGIGGIFLVIHQLVVMISVLGTRKVLQLCKELFVPKDNNNIET